TNLPVQVREKGERLVARLRGLEDRHGVIAEVRGRGLLCAVQFEGDIAEEVARTALGEGLLLNNLRPNVLRIAPPLTISDEEMEERGRARALQAWTARATQAAAMRQASEEEARRARRLQAEAGWERALTTNWPSREAPSSPRLTPAEVEYNRVLTALTQVLPS